ncbi:UDP-glucuronosyltransferase 2B15 [Drosophila pseudoobscura]|uniref:UDP-glucuronosyltransferase n=1 Tax=Drosophila pseudoobscura pseudoobscura TaxID=46245 RepID=A0A6I8US38_DROPS|nr:UDP-glucuronosyltransferase 2B15 [Drosophila pseudoobscura]
MRILFVFIGSILLALGGLPLPAEGAKILATLAWPGRSQYIFVENYLKGLAARGHEVTVINTFKNKATPNMRFIEALKVQEFHQQMLAELEASTLWQEFNAITGLEEKVAAFTLDDEGVQKLMKSGETFDVVLAEMIEVPALYGMAQHFNATLVGFSSYGSDYRIDSQLGNTSPLSYNPSIMSPRTDRMSFCERLTNHYEYLVEMLHRQLVHLPAMERMYNKYYPNARQTMDEVLDSFALVLLGQHFSLSYPRPFLPNMIEVGGLHIAHKPQPLPEDIKAFIEGAEHGVIYFSMGSNVKSKDLPQETRDTLLKTFGKLKQRVLWKFEDDQLPGKPANVLIKKWFPQPDILAQTNVKLFITHGGLLSTIESLYFGKPVLGLPVFYDQHMNVARARRVGFGLGLDLYNLNEEDLEEAIHKLLSEPSFAKASAQISERYRDQPQPSLERAIWWTEYVIRHQGAPHLRATSRDLNFIQLYSLDTLFVLVGLPLLLVALLLKVSCRLLQGRKPKGCPYADKLKKQ